AGRAAPDLSVRRREIHTGELAFAFGLGPGRDVVTADQRIVLHGFQVHIEAPEAMQVLQHLFGGAAQRLAVVLLVAQGQRTIAAAVHAPDLYVGLAVAQVVLRRQ